MQEKGLDFRFLLSRKIDPPLRSVAVREARATTACCGGKNFFWGVLFAKTNPPHFENSAFFVEDLESPEAFHFFFFFCTHLIPSQPSLFSICVLPEKLKKKKTKSAVFPFTNNSHFLIR